MFLQRFEVWYVSVYRERFAVKATVVAYPSKGRFVDLWCTVTIIMVRQKGRERETECE